MNADDAALAMLAAFWSGVIFCYGLLRGCGLLRSRVEHFRWREREGLPTPSGWEEEGDETS